MKKMIKAFLKIGQGTAQKNTILLYGKKVTNSNWPLVFARCFTPVASNSWHCRKVISCHAVRICAADSNPSSATAHSRMWFLYFAGHHPGKCLDEFPETRHLGGRDSAPANPGHFFLGQRLARPIRNGLSGRDANRRITRAIMSGADQPTGLPAANSGSRCRNQGLQGVLPVLIKNLSQAKMSCTIRAGRPSVRRCSRPLW